MPPPRLAPSVPVFDRDALRSRREVIGPRPEAAPRLGLSVHHLRALEEGRRQPSLAMLCALASALDVPVSSLLRDGGPR